MVSISVSFTRQTKTQTYQPCFCLLRNSALIACSANSRSNLISSSSLNGAADRFVLCDGCEHNDRALLCGVIQTVAAYKLGNFGILFSKHSTVNIQIGTSTLQLLKVKNSKEKVESQLQLRCIQFG